MKIPSFNPHLDKANQPQGLARYLDTFFLNIGQFLVCNLLFLLCCIPVVTIGAGLIALARVACTALRGRQISPVSDFFEAVRGNFKAGLFVTFGFLPLYLWTLYMGITFWQVNLENGSSLLPAMVFTLGFLFLNAFALYLFPLLAYMKADGYTVLRNALLLVIGGKGYSFGGALVCTVAVLLGIFTLPKSFPLLVTIYFSALVYTGCFFGWKIIDKYIFSPYYEAHPDTMYADDY